MDFFVFLSPLLFTLSLIAEYALRKRMAFYPANRHQLKDFWMKRVGRETSSAFFFSLLAFWFFSYWESFLLTILEHEKPMVVRVLGLIIFLSLIFFRFQYLKKTALYPAWLFGGLCLSWWLMYGWVFAPLLLPWVFYRYRALALAPH